MGGGVQHAAGGHPRAGVDGDDGSAHVNGVGHGVGEGKEGVGFGLGLGTWEGFLS